MRTLLLLFAFGVASATNAQAPFTLQITDSSTGTFQPVDFEPTIDGGYIIGGSDLAFNGNPKIVKLDASGNVEWAKAVWNSGAAAHAPVAAVGQSVSGNIFVLVDASDGGMVYDFTLAEFDLNGNLVWEKTISLDNYYQNYYTGFHKVEQLSTGEYYILPSAYHTVPIIKLTATGDLIWAKELDGDSPTDKTPAFDYHVSSSGEITGACKDENDRMVFRMDASGNVIWSEKYVSGLYTHTKCITQTSDGNYVMGGYQAGAWGAFIMKIAASDGSIMWYQAYDGVGQVWDISETASGGLLASADNGSTGSLRFLELDDLGNVTDAWEAITGIHNVAVPNYSQLTGGEFILSARDQTSSGAGLLLRGYDNGGFGCGFQPITVSYSGYDYSGVTYQSNYVTVSNVGTQVASALSISDVTTITTSDFCETFTNVDVIEELEMDLYPNPANEVVTLQALYPGGNYQLVNLTGQIVLHGRLEGETAVLDVSELTSGLYFLSLEQNGNVITQKLVVE